MPEDQDFSEEAVQRVILASAPEREGELRAIWAEHCPHIQLTEDKVGFSLGESFGSVLFDHKTMCQIWLLGFAAQKAFNAYSGFLVSSQLFGLPFSPAMISAHPHYAGLANECQGILEKIDELSEMERLEHSEWPANVPAPMGKPSDLNGCMAFDLICMAGAYCFLHEIKHVMLRTSDEQLTQHEEEIRCDGFARDFLLSQIDQYARTSGYPLDVLKAKRSMGIALASVLLLVITPRALWSGSAIHPPVASRIVELTNRLEIQASYHFWIYLSCLLLAQIKKDGLVFFNQIITNPREYCLSLLTCIENASGE